MIYDCFSFFNELDLLEIRLNALNEVVDRFVLVEDTVTHQNKKKPLYFEENKERFSPFLHKIEHIVVEKHPKFLTGLKRTTPWHFENNQRNHISLGLTNCGPEDMIMVSDLDEIPDPEVVKKNKNEEGLIGLDQYLFLFYLNLISFEKDSEEHTMWSGTVMTKFKNIKTVQEMRDRRDADSKEFKRLPKAGWHFSYLGGIDRIITKLESFAHSEYNNDIYKDPERIRERIESGQHLYDGNTKLRILEDDGLLPEYLSANKERYNNFFYSKQSQESGK